LTVYLDTSFLVSLYTQDAHSHRAASYITKAAAPFPLTGFLRAETTNAIELRIFRGEITAFQASQALGDLTSDLNTSLYYEAPMPPDVYETAQRLSRKHTATLGSRTLDILHVASALVLKADAFYTFDRRQARLARAAGVKTPVRIP